jgi:DNA-binding beta-propeller fold protein YncE
VYLDGNWKDFDIHLSQGSVFATHESYPSSWGKKMSVIQDASPSSPAPEPVPPAIIATFDLPEKGTDIAVDSATNRLYVGVGGGISVYNATSLDSLSYIPLSNNLTSPFVNDIGVDEARNRVYAVTASGTYVINGANNQVMGTLGNGEDIAVNPANGRVYISDTGFYLGEPDVVKVYDGVGLSYIRTINLGTSSYYQDIEMAVNPTTGYAYCTYSLDDGLHIISPVTDDVIQTIKYPSIGHVVVNPVTNRVYVWVSRSNLTGALILDGITHAELGTVKGANGQLGINPQTNRLYGRIFETLFQSFDGELGTPLTRVFLDGKARDYAIHTGLSRLYVTYADYPAEWANKVSVIQDTIEKTVWIFLPLVVR